MASVDICPSRSSVMPPLETRERIEFIFGTYFLLDNKLHHWGVMG